LTSTNNRSRPLDFLLFVSVVVLPEFWLEKYISWLV